MSGCHYTPCGCMCHTTGIKTVCASNPPIPCCPCDVLSKPVSPMVENIQKLWERVIELEDFRRQQTDWCLDKQELLRIIDSRLDSIELITIQLPIPTKLVEKKPHKCPVCDGLGEFELHSAEDIIKAGGVRFPVCNACEGKGIVWG